MRGRGIVDGKSGWEKEKILENNEMGKGLRGRVNSLN
jgi:hypothetical protein